MKRSDRGNHVFELAKLYRARVTHSERRLGVLGICIAVLRRVPQTYSLTVAFRVVTYYRVVQKTDSQFYFWDNFGNSAPILTIFFHCYKQKFMARKREVLPPTALLLCDHIT